MSSSNWLLGCMTMVLLPVSARSPVPWTTALAAETTSAPSPEPEASAASEDQPSLIDLRPLFDQVTKETRDWQRNRYAEKQKIDIEWMKTNKVFVNEVKDLSAFQAKVKPLWDKYTPKIGQDLINQALATK